MSSYRPDPSRELLITRDSRDSRAPWNGLRFTLPADSDELWERLKELYPDYKNHHQRQTRALIDFLITELEDHQRGGSTASSIGENSALRNSPREMEDSIVGSENQSPASCSSPAQALSPTLSRLSQPVPGNSDPTKAQMLVWSITDGNEVKQKGRRKMSQQERLDYRETRMKGACALCRGKKNKCTHVREQTSDESAQEASARPKKRLRSADTEEDINEPFQSPGISHSEKPPTTSSSTPLNSSSTPLNRPGRNFCATTTGPDVNEPYIDRPWEHTDPATSSGAQQTVYVPTNVHFPLDYPNQVPGFPAYPLNTQVPEQMDTFDPGYPMEPSSSARDELSTPFPVNDSFYFTSDTPYNPNPWTEGTHPYSRTSKPP